MGNIFWPSYHYDELEVMTLYKLFVGLHCVMKEEIWVDYYTFCYAFGVFLSTQECKRVDTCIDEYINWGGVYSRTKYWRKRKIERDDYIHFAVKTVDDMCRHGQITRIGRTDQNLILYGMRLHTFPKL